MEPMKRSGLKIHMCVCVPQRVVLVIIKARGVNKVG